MADGIQEDKAILLRHMGDYQDRSKMERRLMKVCACLIHRLDVLALEVEKWHGTPCEKARPHTVRVVAVDNETGEEFGLGIDVIKASSPEAAADGIVWVYDAILEITAGGLPFNIEDLD